MALHIHQDYAGAQLRRQGVKGRRKLISELGSFGEFLRRLAIPGLRPLERRLIPLQSLKWDLPPAALRAAAVQIDAEQHTVEPAAKIKSLIVKLRFLNNPHKSFLHQIAGVGLIPGQAVGGDICLAAVRFN